MTFEEDLQRFLEEGVPTNCKVRIEVEDEGAVIIHGLVDGLYEFERRCANTDEGIEGLFDLMEFIKEVSEWKKGMDE